jgi:UDPglucose 6-dehydrogenase
MKYGVIGVGVVGGAMLRSFQEKTSGQETIVGYDKYKKIGSLEDVLDAEMVFLSLPTLYSEEMKSYDKTSINEVCEQLEAANYKGLVVIKSTVEPTTVDTLAKKWSLSLVHNPEFLTAKTAYEDFHEQKHIVIGSTTTTNPSRVDALVQFYNKYYPDADITLCTATESESIKIFCNTFYAVKIQYFNELYLLCQKTGANYDFVVSSMIKNNWINPMHTKVPGTDGQLGFGGMCFPKDTAALLSFMQEIGTPHSVLESAVAENKQIRGDSH